MSDAVKHALRRAALFLVIASVATAASAQQHKGDHREWPGLERHDCGADLHVVQTDGHEQVFYPPETFYAKLPTVEINMGEQTRRAFALSAVLERFHAQSVELGGCGKHEPKAFAASPEAASIFLVLTGKGLIKVVQKGPHGEYSSVLNPLSQLNFRDAAKQPPSP